MQNKETRKKFLTLKTILLCLSSFIIIEGLLFISEKWFRVQVFHLFRDTFAENFYYFHFNEKPDKSPPAIFDPVIGWSGFRDKLRVESLENNDYKTHKKKRILVFGDSYIYGWDLPREEALPFQLEKELPGEFEVFNFGVQGYGIDQMALLAKTWVPKLKPSLIIVGFISPDLHRSCFDFQFNMKKPSLEIRNKILTTTGIPILTPFDQFELHQRPFRRIKDFIFTELTRSRLLCLSAQLLLTSNYKKCIGNLNFKILEMMEEEFAMPVLFAHLDFKLPKSFSNLTHKLTNYISLPELIPTFAKRNGITPETFPDGHPKKSLNQLYAKILKDEILNRLKKD